jgi:hypothetical protein
MVMWARIDTFFQQFRWAQLSSLTDAMAIAYEEWRRNPVFGLRAPETTSGSAIGSCPMPPMPTTTPGHAVAFGSVGGVRCCMP